MGELERNIEAASLAEHLASRGGKCPIPFTHDRLHETHHWWHEMARYYHEPQPFRYSLGAFIQAARNVTFMLQKEQSAYKEFTWYLEWRKQAKADPLLKWLHDTRTNFVHCESLEPHSWLEMRCLKENMPPQDEDDESLSFSVSPFQCTHYYMEHGPETDHPHEFERFWGIDSLPSRELLEACAEIYDRLDDLVHEAHRRLGAQMPSHRQEGSKRALPCMEEILKYRIARTSIQNGREIWDGQTPDIHNH